MKTEYKQELEELSKQGSELSINIKEAHDSNQDLCKELKPYQKQEKNALRDIKNMDNLYPPNWQIKKEEHEQKLKVKSELKDEVKGMECKIGMLDSNLLRSG